MAPKILLLNVSPNACLLECKHAAQKFIIAADAVFLKAQGLATLAPLHETVFGLLKGLLDDWHLLNLMTIEWLRKAEVRQACINIWSLNKQVPWAAEFGKMVVTSLRIVVTEAGRSLCHFWHLVVDTGTFFLMCDRCIANNMANHCWYPTGEHPCWRCYRKSKGCLWNGVGVRTQKKRPPLAVLVVAKHIKLVQAAKVFLEQQGKPSQFFVLEGYKGKGKAKALVEDSEPTSTKQFFKSRELVDSDNDKEEEEDRVCMIKKIKREHIEEPTGAKRRQEIMELDNEVEIVASKIPAAGPLYPTSKPIVLVPSMSKFVPKPIVTLASPLAGPSTAPIALSSAPKPVAATALSKPAPAKSAGPAVKGGSIFKDPFMVRRFKLAGMEESGVLIINQAIEVLAIQGTLHSEESGDEDAEGDNDDSDGGDVAMNVDSAKQPKET
ncbi:hypothetical protein C0995_009651 [Termitomyces sp. Mi166|nr:hypothetical protein C0995_009651 [Termitomyces sp. Mi166\